MTQKKESKNLSLSRNSCPVQFSASSVTNSAADNSGRVKVDPQKWHEKFSFGARVAQGIEVGTNPADSRFLSCWNTAVIR